MRAILRAIMKAIMRAILRAIMKAIMRAIMKAIMKAICHVELSTNTTGVGLGTKSRDAACTLSFIFANKNSTTADFFKTSNCDGACCTVNAV
jgi:hypothetical protein